MKRLTDVFYEKRFTFSFELFPPKTEEGYEKLFHTIDLLSKFKPSFISVTSGAGGRFQYKKKTLQIVDYIQRNNNIIGLPHLTCVYDNKEEIKEILEQYKKHNVKNILALRGDPPKDNPDWQPKENNFKFSYELTNFIRENYGDDFSIGVAGFPEGHPLCENVELDAKYLKNKIDSGADFVMTQLFFDNNDYFNYVNRLKKLGVNARVIPGIIPITDYENTVRFCKGCGTTIPQKVHDIFSKIKDDKEAVLDAGIQFAIDQCVDLLKHNAPGLHFYTLNKIYPTSIILNAVKTEFGLE